MDIRAMKKEDLEIIQKIHDEFYSPEFQFPDFSSNFICSFVVTDDENQIISAGGLRPIVEVIAVTNKRQTVRKRREALYDILSASTYLGNKAGYDQIHAFIQEHGWESHLRKVGFIDTKGKALVLSI